MLDLKGTGVHTIAQDEQSCVVFGMPREAIRMGGVDEVVPLTRIAAAILAAVSAPSVR
jgi:two-component system chemotaxis response regulator CheB